MGGIAHVGGNELGQILTDEIFTHDYDYHACRADVLLYAAVDNAVIGNIAGL